LEFKELYYKLDLFLLEIIPESKEIVKYEIMSALETDGFLNDEEGIQFVDMDKLFKKAFPIIRDRICRLKWKNGAENVKKKQYLNVFNVAFIAIYKFIKIHRIIMQWQCQPSNSEFAFIPLNLASWNTQKYLYLQKILSFFIPEI